MIGFFIYLPWHSSGISARLRRADLRGTTGVHRYRRLHPMVLRDIVHLSPWVAIVLAGVGE